MKVLTPDRQGTLRSELARMADKGRPSGASAFLEMLKSASGGHAENGNVNEALPPDKDKLQVMIRLLQLQMNQRLIHSVMTTEEGQVDFGTDLFRSNALNLPAAPLKNPDGPSKNQPEPVAAPSIATTSVKNSPWRRAAGGFDDIIGRAAKTYQVDADLITAVIKTESNFNPEAVSPKGARGLMQLMPATARDLGVKNPHDPEENIMAGTRYLKGLLDRYDGDVNLALAAYNWGMGNVERSPGRMPRETINYVARINAYYQG